ncbi:lanthionine synthetase C family protein [Streptomyces sp. NPDC048057]|uniref:lanthionine synthetase C family protein n=1 Tax=Streptomyces sp. NPDC048057 TaxID=3155628 RepID=UPI0033CB2641
MSTEEAAAGTAARAQSLSRGAVGDALLLIERAQNGTEDWAAVHELLRTVTAHGLLAGEDASLFFGAPAVAFALHTAAGGTDRYARALSTLDAAVATVTDRRLALANARIDRSVRPRAAEFDVLYGLTGLGAYWLRRDPRGSRLPEVLAYLVRLTRPLPGHPDRLPGWWVGHGPTVSSSDGFAFTDGHANVGMAHGIAGPLSLLALAMRQGITVDGHAEAIGRICAWLDAIRGEGALGFWWPRWLTLPEHRVGSVAGSGSPPPSWCYGSSGLARAQQLAALAVGDAERQRMAEGVLVRAFTEPAHLAGVQDAGLCHGTAGLLQIARRAAQDAPPGAFAAPIARLHSLLLEQEPARTEGFLGGPTGVALALATAPTAVPTSDWDTCLLIT